MNTIYTRRSVRTFQEKNVSNQIITQLLKAAMQAPSSGNQQPWEFIVLNDKEKIKKLSNYSLYAKTLANANVAIIVLANLKRVKNPKYYHQDLAAATQNILLEGTSLGLGTVWYSIAPNDEKINYVQKLYNMDQNYIPFSIVGIGYPLNENANHYIDRFDENRIHYR